MQQSLGGLLESKVLGQLQDYPAVSCQQLASMMINGALRSGYYWLQSSNGSSVRVYCDLTTSFRVGSNGYMQVANLNMTIPTQTCPKALTSTSDLCNKRMCGRGSSSPGCSSVFFPTFEIPYSKVCGSIIGYQFASPNAFFAYQLDPNITVDDVYLDGVSLTYGSSPRKHVWSFAAADELSTYCPCTNADRSLPFSPLPTFVKRNFFCDSSNFNGGDTCSHLLWDGRGCSPKNSCCQDYNHWFCVNLDEIVIDDIEMRLCGNEDTMNEDTPIESVHLYVQ